MKERGPSTGRVVYVYGITRASAKPTHCPRIGIDGSSAVEPVELDELVCWVSHVDADEFGDQLPEMMENLEWLAEAGVRHQQVVAEIAESADVLPARFGTVFHSDESLVADLKRRKRVITGALKRVAGADEWGVKVFAVPRTSPVQQDVRSGKEYLRQKAAALQRRGNGKTDPEIARLASALKKTAVAAAGAGKVGTGQSNLQWQASFLVPRGRKAKFNSVLRQFASKWKGEKTIECTGPWPPYSFVSRDAR